MERSELSPGCGGDEATDLTVGAVAMSDLLQPSTDAGALVEVVVTVAVAAGVALLVRRERSLVLLVVGATLVIIGSFGFRSLH